ncbi:MAG: hypothetical protein A3E25_16790 [Burkholderiales bacterium RIFCSPHIGHO2_12_FULL_69_20]|nr:MAG: hypothetical protein A3E25_16790 [Burkholderiales bacterium RIFCSPHIGHO2_12_FULL_69_20]
MTTISEIRQCLTVQLGANLKQQGAATVPSTVNEFLRATTSLGDLDHYKHFPPDCYRLVAASGGEQAQRLFLESVLLQGMSQTIDSSRFTALPPRTRNHQCAQFNRILRRENPLPSWLDMESDLFHKEFGLAALRLHAGAAQVIDPRCGVPKSIVLKSGLPGLAQGIRVAVECRGLKPMLQIHTHTAYLDEFNDEGWRECYRVCVELYGLYPRIKGMFGGSWFYDPVIQQISPRLSYLSSVPRQGGARFLRVATEGDFVQDAIATSPSRRKLYDEGRYRPISYMMIWGRSAQTSWVRTTDSPEA